MLLDKQQNAIDKICVAYRVLIEIFQYLLL